MHTSGSEHESSFMIRLMRESGSSCRGIVFELAPFCASSFCALTCSVSRVSHKWFIRSTCDWSFGGSEVGSTRFLDVLSGSSTRWLGTVALGARKLTNVLGSAGRRPPSSPKVGMATRVADGGRGSRSVGVTMRLGALGCALLHGSLRDQETCPGTLRALWQVTGFPICTKFTPYVASLIT